MKRLLTIVLALALYAAAAPARAQFVGRFGPSYVVPVPGPVTCWPNSYCAPSAYGPFVGYPLGYAPPPLYAGYWYGYGFGNHAPGVWGTEFAWEAKQPHVQGYTLPGGQP